MTPTIEHEGTSGIKKKYTVVYYENKKGSYVKRNLIQI